MPLIKATLSEHVYNDLPRMFEPSNGLVQAPLCWYTYLKKGLLESGFTPSELNACLYFGHGMAVLT